MSLATGSAFGEDFLSSSAGGVSFSFSESLAFFSTTGIGGAEFLSLMGADDSFSSGDFFSSIGAVSFFSSVGAFLSSTGTADSFSSTGDFFSSTGA